MTSTSTAVDPSRDVRANRTAVALLRRLATQGIALKVERGMLGTCHAQPSLRAEDLAALKTHARDVLVLLLIADARCQVRLVNRRAGAVALRPEQATGACYVCSAALPNHRAIGRCGWCALAARLSVGAHISADLVSLFDEDIQGPRQPGLEAWPA